MKTLGPLSCLRCGREPDSPSRHLGCSSCRREGQPSNFVWRSSEPPVLNGVGVGIWRFRGSLPTTTEVSLGEGNTPVIKLGRLGPTLGVPNLWVKNESVNPTWSHKDRLAAVTVSAAVDAEASVVAVASTGNHGAAVAAYAARAGIRCVIATLLDVPAAMKDLMVAFGAEVWATARSEARYDMVALGAEEFGWYAASNLAFPPIGSDAYGIAGYKTLAYELIEEFGDDLDWVVVPVAYGDCLAGVAQGFLEAHSAGVIKKVPRMVGAELFGALEAALRDDEMVTVPTHDTYAFSIGGSVATYQSRWAIKETAGVAISISDQRLREVGDLMASTEGLYVESASAVAVAASAELVARGLAASDAKVVAIVTSTGMKNLPGARLASGAIGEFDPGNEDMKSLVRRVHESGTK